MMSIPHRRARASAVTEGAKLSSKPALYALAAALSCFGACAATPAVRDDIAPEYDPTGRLTRLSYDRDGDGKIDTWGVMDGARVIRVESDEDGNGSVDRWEYHHTVGSSGASAAAPGPGGAVAAPDQTIERVDRATRHDGKVSRWEYFSAGALVRVEEDTDADGAVDKWEVYDNGSLSVLSLDTHGRGAPDRRFVYASDGALLRIEGETTGAGSLGPTQP